MFSIRLAEGDKLKKNKYLKLVLLLLIMLLTVSCTTTKKVKNSQVKELTKEIQKIEYISKIKVFSLGPYVGMDIYVEEDFNQEKGLEILDLAKKYFNEDTKNELMTELKKIYPPDIEIAIRNGEGREGKIIFSFLGSCYESYDRGIPPDFDQYEWSYWDDETQSRITY